MYVNGPKIITDGLVLALDAANTKSYAGSGATWNDVSGNNRTTSLVNTPTFNAANNGSISFDGTNEYASIPSPSPLSGNNLFTTEFWINTTSITGDFGGIYKAACLFGGGTGDGVRQPELFILSANNTSFTPNIITFGAGGGLAAGTCDVNVSALMSNGSWYQIVLARTAAAAQVIYINGSQVATGNSSYSFDDGQTDFGALHANVSYDAFFNGKMASIKIYNRALSATEVLQNFNATRSRFGV
jgi:hypothetical protein